MYVLEGVYVNFYKPPPSLQLHIATTTAGYYGAQNAPAYMNLGGNGSCSLVNEQSTTMPSYIG